MEVMSEFSKGIFFNKPRENAPDFVLGSLSIRREEFVEYLKELNPNDNGYIKLDILLARDGEKTYLKENNWTPENKDSNSEEVF